jgi:hypothetical protein
MSKEAKPPRDNTLGTKWRSTRGQRCPTESMGIGKRKEEERKRKKGKKEKRREKKGGEIGKDKTVRIDRNNQGYEERRNKRITIPASILRRPKPKVFLLFPLDRRTLYLLRLSSTTILPRLYLPSDSFLSYYPQDG